MQLRGENVEVSITLVGPQWIEKSGLNVKIIDVRRRVDYEAGHIPGAISIPVTIFVKSIGRLKDALGPQEFEDLMSKFGIQNESIIVTYDDQWGVYASRLLWTLDLYGHKDLYLLDRNFLIYKRDKGRVSHSNPEIKKSIYVAKLNAHFASSISHISKIVDNTNEMIIDAGERMDFLNGHIPGAINLPWRLCLGKDRNFLPKERIKRIFKEHGLSIGNEANIYCKDVMTSSDIYAALRICGYEKVKLYSRGYAEWEETNKPKVAEFQELLNP